MLKAHKHRNKHSNSLEPTILFTPFNKNNQHSIKPFLYVLAPNQQIPVILQSPNFSQKQLSQNYAVLYTNNNILPNIKYKKRHKF